MAVLLIAPDSIRTRCLSPVAGREHGHNPRVRQRDEKPREAELTRRERRFLAGLNPPWRIQKFLDGLDYDVAGAGCRSPRRVLRERTVQCMDGALFAAAALRVQGHPPLVLDLEAVYDDDHVLAVFRGDGGWGAIARSNYSGLRFREAIHPTIRSLVLSYFESYFNLRRQKTLRRYSRPVNLSRFDAIDWMTSEEDLWDIPDYLAGVRHTRLLPARVEKRLSPVDRRMFEAGLVGRADRRRESL
jgi:hypothetical protein